MQNKGLPKILYVSDVPVELSYAGATLMYRLLEHYPKDKLMVIQGTEMNSRERIDGVEYYILKSRLVDRLKISRFWKRINGLLIINQYIRSRKILKLAKSFKPDIILTVSFHVTWLNAFRLSTRLNIPLHLILHDDWLITENYGRWHTRLENAFGKMYKKAAGRFCICPAMEKYYYDLYKVHGDILYPLRGKNDQMLPLCEKGNTQNKTLKYCYAGSLFTADFAPMLNEIAALIREQQGELHIFSTTTKDAMTKYEHLTADHVNFHNLVHPAELINIMNKEMDVAVLLNSFTYETAFQYNFSSKLVDYSSAGIAVLFWGAASSGVISWALASGYKGIATSQEPQEIASLVEQFKNDETRYAWAEQIKKLGTEQFSYEKNYNSFIKRISS